MLPTKYCVSFVIAVLSFNSFAFSQDGFSLNSSAEKQEILPFIDLRSLGEFTVGEVGIFEDFSLCESREKIAMSPNANPVSEHSFSNPSGAMLMEVTKISDREVSVLLMEPPAGVELTTALDRLVERLTTREFYKKTLLKRCPKIEEEECQATLCRPLVTLESAGYEPNLIVKEIDGFEDFDSLLNSLRLKGWYTE